MRRCMLTGVAAGDLVVAEDLEEVEVAEVTCVGLGQAGVEGLAACRTASARGAAAVGEGRWS